MKDVIISTGTGYEGDTTFDGYRIIREPLPNRQDRVFSQGEGPGTCYGSHWLALAVSNEEYDNSLYLLMEHGSGRVVMCLPTFYNDGGAMRDAWLAMPDRVLYATLYTLQNSLNMAARAASYDAERKWALAYHEKRIRTRTRGGRRYFSIESAAEKATRTGKPVHEAA